MITRRDQLGHKAEKKEAEPRGNRGRGRGKSRGSGGRGRGGRGRGRSQGAGKDDSEHEEEKENTNPKKTARKSSSPKTSESRQAKKVKQVKEDGGHEGFQKKPEVLKRCRSKTSVAAADEEENANTTKKRSRAKKTTNPEEETGRKSRTKTKPEKAKEVEPEMNPEAASSRKKKQNPASGSQDRDAAASSSRPRRAPRKAETSKGVNDVDTVKRKAIELEVWTQCIAFTTLEFHDLKYYTKELLCHQLPETPHAALNIYWKRSSCGVKIREGDVTTKMKDAFYFSCPKDATGSESLKMLLSIGAAKGMVSW